MPMAFESIFCLHFVDEMFDLLIERVDIRRILVRLQTCLIDCGLGMSRHSLDPLSMRHRMIRRVLRVLHRMLHATATKREHASHHANHGSPIRCLNRWNLLFGIELRETPCRDDWTFDGTPGLTGINIAHPRTRELDQGAAEISNYKGVHWQRLKSKARNPIGVSKVHCCRALV
jgi:hypothetical protein